MIDKVLSNEFFEAHDWPVATAIAVVLIAALALPILFTQRLFDREPAA